VLSRLNFPAAAALSRRARPARISTRGIKTMSGAFVIEIEDRAAGLVLAEKGGFLFRASDPIFRKLDGQMFPHVSQARTAATQIWRAHCARAAASTQAVEPASIQISWDAARPASPAAPALAGGRHYVRRAVGT
jgi:hypothetical protein